ncbi:AroM family protein [Rhodoplanes serenus]|uniref:AroM family protein n=1 Tax=Rhodoplanes serenus TaxID=200615 RepID=A0A9X4XIE8_9BRAD|nr:AroM family protein [Rhodoplanes serenus]
MSEPRQRRIAFVTIGQAPRRDVVPEMAALVGSHVRIDEYGVLDGLDAAAIAALGPRPGAYRFATRLADGTAVELDKAATEDRLATLVARLDGAGYDLLVPLCTGAALPATATLTVEPQQVVDHTLAALAHRCRRVGVVVPLAAQVDTLHLSVPVDCPVRLVHASPYEPDPARAAAAFAAAGTALADCDVVLMHCMGYGAAMRTMVAAAAGRPVLLSTHLVARLLAQILE